MVTASHLPSHRNGFKFFTMAGGLAKQDISEVIYLQLKSKTILVLPKEGISSVATRDRTLCLGLK